MDEIEGSLWEFNLAKIVIVDVTDDYALMRAPMPTYCYPVVAEVWLPKHRLVDRLPTEPLVDGFLYDWHQKPRSETSDWIVGVVRCDLARVC